MGSIAPLSLTTLLPSQAVAASSVAPPAKADQYIAPSEIASPTLSANPFEIDADAFVRHVAAQNFEKLGSPLLSADTIVTGLEVGTPLVYATGKKYIWDTMPSDPGHTCQIRARGMILIQAGDNRDAIINLIDRALANPYNHPMLMVGVDQSVNVKEFPVNAPTVGHVHNLQASGTMQYLSDVTSTEVPQGMIYVQKSLDDFDFFMPPDQPRFPNKVTGLMNKYNGQVQVLKIGGDQIAIVIEMKANIARVQTPFCRLAADIRIGPVAFSRQPVAQRIEDRLIHVAAFATDPSWASEHHIELAPSRITLR